MTLIGIRACNRVRGDREDAGGAGIHRSSQDVPGTLDVDLLEVPRVTRVDNAAEVEYRSALGAAKEVDERARITDVPRDELDIRRQRRERGRRSFRQNETADSPSALGPRQLG